MELPIFKYHPDPIKTGAIEVTSATCECCGIAQGFRATSTIYAKEQYKLFVLGVLRMARQLKN
jgi:uncharacterized protein CbrC (UPF0167 family)